MAAFDGPFFNYDLTADLSCWTPSGAAMADPISRPTSTRAQMLYGIGAGQNHHSEAPHIHSPYVDPFEFEGYPIPQQVLYHNQKGQDVTFSPLDLLLPQEGYQHDSPKSEDSSQSGDTFSASCYTDDLHVQALHHRHSISSPQMMQEPYYGLPTQAQSPQLPPGLGGGISLDVVQNFEDQIMERNQDFQDSAYSEPDAEGESDHEYPTITLQDPSAKRSPRHERVEKPSIAESTIDSMSEDFNEPEEEEDADYNPRRAANSRPRRNAAGRRTSHGRRPSNSGHGGRVTKPKSRKSSHGSLIRPFPCPLAQYGCGSTFTSKNEWKRHVSTQHIKLGFWRCDMCSIGDLDNPVYNDFNRKDLFTQHLRRMHRNHPLTTSHVLNDAGEEEISEEAMAQHQERCYIVLRSNPSESTCLFNHCDKTFEGDSSWEERMEHVGAHMEKDRKANKSVLPSEEWREDIDLRNYLEQEGLIEYDGGRWSIGDGKPKREGY